MTGSGHSERYDPPPAVHGVDTPGGGHIRLSHYGNGPLVLLLHGIGGHAGQWAEVASAIGGCAHAVTWDARGYGASTGRPIQAFSELADDLVAVIEALGGGPVLAVGHSMGGRILIEAACARPDLFGALFLSGAQPAYLAHLTPAEREGYVARRLAMFENGTVAPDRARGVAAEVLPPDAPEALIARLAADFERLRPEGYGAALRASAGWDRRADLHRLGMPVVVMGGALDPVCPPQETRALAKAVGAGEVHLLDGISHMAQLEAPQQVTTLIRGFVLSHGHRAARITGAQTASGEVTT